MNENSSAVAAYHSAKVEVQAGLDFDLRLPGFLAPGGLRPGSKLQVQVVPLHPGTIARQVSERELRSERRIVNVKIPITNTRGEWPWPGAAQRVNEPPARRRCHDLRAPRR